MIQRIPVIIYVIIKTAAEVLSKRPNIGLLDVLTCIYCVKKQGRCTKRYVPFVRGSETRKMFLLLSAFLAVNNKGLI